MNLQSPSALLTFWPAIIDPWSRLFPNIIDKQNPLQNIFSFEWNKTLCMSGLVRPRQESAKINTDCWLAYSERLSLTHSVHSGRVWASYYRGVGKQGDLRNPAIPFRFTFIIFSWLGINSHRVQKSFFFDKSRLLSIQLISMATTITNSTQRMNGVIKDRGAL